MLKVLSPRVAAEIRTEQGRRKITGTELARRMGQPKTTVSRWLAGTAPMGLDEIAAFASALDVSTVDLVKAAMAKESTLGGDDNTATHRYYVDSCADRMLDLIAA